MNKAMGMVVALLLIFCLSGFVFAQEESLNETQINVTQIDLTQPAVVQETTPSSVAQQSTTAKRASTSRGVIISPKERKHKEPLRPTDIGKYDPDTIIGTVVSVDGAKKQMVVQSNAMPKPRILNLNDIDIERVKAGDQVRVIVRDDEVVSLKVIKKADTTTKKMIDRWSVVDRK